MKKITIGHIIRGYIGNTDFSVTVKIDQIGRKAITINSIVINKEANIDFNNNLLLIAIYFTLSIHSNILITQSLISSLTYRNVTSVSQAFNQISISYLLFICCFLSIILFICSFIPCKNKLDFTFSIYFYIEIVDYIDNYYMYRGNAFSIDEKYGNKKSTNHR